MLIVAIPKSASTSLLYTLGDMHKIPASQQFFYNYPKPSKLKLLYDWHSDVREFTIEEAKTFSSQKNFIKQHIPPTENNLFLLRDIKKVVLLREPKEIIEAYYRAEQKKLHKPRKEFEGARNLSDWYSKASKNGLLYELNWFYNRWLEEISTYPSQNLLIQFEELSKNPQPSINSIEKFFDLPQSMQVKLQKERYSRHSALTLALSKLNRETKKIGIKIFKSLIRKL